MRVAQMMPLRFVLLVLPLFVLSIYTGCASAASDGNAAPSGEEKTDAAQEGGVNTHPLSIDPDLAICTAIVFLLLLLILAKFAWRPIMQGLEKREQSIAGQIEEAHQANQKAAQTLEQYQARLAAAADEVRAIVAEGKREAEAARAQILAEAQEAARREQQRAVAEIAAAKNQALGEIAATHVDHAFALARQVIRKEISRDEHGVLIRDSLERFPAN
jgi:F-type H+-transporting ATPase subunit b